jgi:hypothetical protein
MQHAKALHINLNQLQPASVGQLGKQLAAFRRSDLAGVKLYGEKEGYAYQLTTDWTLALDDACILVLERELGQSAFNIVYS